MPGATSPKDRTISAIVPVHNEEGNIAPLLDELTAVLPTVSSRYEVLLVDDGSTDGTHAAATAYMDAHPEHPVRLTRLRRNFGQTAALATGFARARGDLVATLDGDLQNDPADLPALLAEMDTGYDVVCGWRQARAEGVLRQSQSRLAAHVIGWLTGVRVHDFGCTLRVYRTEIARDIDLWGEMHRFIPALCHTVGARVGELPVHHRPRTSGVPKYGKTGLRRALRVALDLFALSANTRHRGHPVRMYGWWALTWALGAFATLAWALAGDKDQALVIGVVTTMLLCALAMLGSGAQAEIAVRAYMRLLGRGPGYVRDEVTTPGWREAWGDQPEPANGRANGWRTGAAAR